VVGEHFTRREAYLANMSSFATPGLAWSAQFSYDILPPDCPPLHDVRSIVETLKKRAFLLKAGVDTWTHFSRHLVHAADLEGVRPARLPHLYASLLAHACNFG